MQEPSLRTSRLAIAGGIAAAITLGGAGFLLGRATAPQPPPPLAPTAAATPVPIPTAEPDRMLGRADLIALATSATDALSTGAEGPEDAREALDRRFELVLPFGCDGPAEDGSTSALRWRYDDQAEVLRIHAAPDSWSAADWGLAEDAGIEAVEGFWVARPWSSGNNCPIRSGRAMATGMDPITLPGQTLAVAQFFTREARRSALRDGRPFEAVLRVPREDFDGSRGFRLRLTGRIDQAPGSTGPLLCVQPGGMDQRPICAVAVTLDEVRIENPVNSGVLATWPIGDN